MIPPNGHCARRTTFKVPGLRWWIAGLLLVATVISYLDRLTLSILAPAICGDLHLSNVQYAGISVWFLLAYSFGQTVFGKLQDRVGTKRGLSIAMILWSVAETLQAATRGLGALCVFRFILGLGEGGHWPAAIKGIAEWFPKQERAFGMGIVNTGATLGSAIAPPLVVWLELSFGWRTTFVATGFLGFIWLVLWSLCYQPPEQHRWLSSQELDSIRNGTPDNQAHTPAQSWIALLKNRKVLGLVLARFLGDPVWWLYLVWLPLYLFRVRGLGLKDIGAFGWIPFVFADAGALIGGWLSGWLIRAGWKPPRARTAAIILATVLAPIGMFVGVVKSEYTAIALISLVLFTFQFWVNNVQTLASDLFPNELVASVSGLAGTGAGIGAMIFTFSTGWIVDHFGYTPVLILSGLLVPAATAALLWLSHEPQDSTGIERACTVGHSPISL